MEQLRGDANCMNQVTRNVRLSLPPLASPPRYQDVGVGNGDSKIGEREKPSDRRLRRTVERLALEIFLRLQDGLDRVIRKKQSIISV